MYQLNIFQAQANMNIPNHRGDTPLSMLQTQLGSLWIGGKVADKVKENLSTSRSRNVLFRIAKDKVNYNLHIIKFIMTIL